MPRFFPCPADWPLVNSTHLYNEAHLCVYYGHRESRHLHCLPMFRGGTQHERISIRCAPLELQQRHQ